MLDRKSSGLNSRDTHSPNCSRALSLDPQCDISLCSLRIDDEIEIRPALCKHKEYDDRKPCLSFATPLSPGLMSGHGQMPRMPARDKYILRPKPGILCRSFWRQLRSALVQVDSERWVPEAWRGGADRHTDSVWDYELIGRPIPAVGSCFFFSCAGMHREE